VPRKNPAPASRSPGVAAEPRPKAGRSAPAEGATPFVSSSHLVSPRSVELSELEFGLTVCGNAFSRWVVRCMAAAGRGDLTATDVLVLHHVNHRARHKKLADICFVLNFEDTHVVAYALKKLVAAARWQFWIDRGGTFTDVVGPAARRRLHTPSCCPRTRSSTATPRWRACAACSAWRRRAITPAQVECVKMGTTVATNALLERKGERTLLVTTRGFRDALRIAYQARPRLFDRRIVLPELLYEQVVEADERVGAHGEVLQPLDEAALRVRCRPPTSGLRACAIVFMHGWRHSAPRGAAAVLAREVGFTQCRCRTRSAR
jgi:hypothetical protein